MTDRVDKGTWVEIHNVVLAPGERAPQVPADTQSVALEMRVRGFLVAPACLAEIVDIVTPAGRRLRGKLVAVEPAHTHTFGASIPELTPIGEEVRAVLRRRRSGS